MGGIDERLLCALSEGGKPCGYTPAVVVEPQTDGTLKVLKGRWARPLCASCPEHDKPPHEQHIRNLVIVHHCYGE